MIYQEVKNWFISTDDEDNVTVSEIATLIKELNVKLNMEDVKTIFGLFAENKIAMLKSEQTLFSPKTGAFKCWYWYTREDFIDDLLTYIAMKAHGKFFIYYESDDFMQGLNVVKIA